MKPYLLFFILLLALCICGACYNQVALTGGPRDERPPVLDTLLSFKNEQVHFQKQLIELYFDEFINLRDPAKQIVVSPPLLYPPKVNARLKRVQFDFDEREVLKEEVTYIINFGESIQDFNENNKLLNFTLVVSTGDYIDSLKIRGTVKDAFTNDPADEVLVMLYDRFFDSIPYLERPFYFAKTAKDGSFTINNVRADTFKVFALIDQNLNYLYDNPSEKIGFSDSLLILNDTIQIDLSLTVFKEQSVPVYRGFEVVNQGKINLEFDAIGPVTGISGLDSVDFYLENREEDLIKTLWYRPRELSAFKIQIEKGGEFDTVSIRINRRTVDTLANQIKIATMNADNKYGLDPQKDLILTFDRPVSTINVDNIVLIKVDSVQSDTLLINVVDTVFPRMKVTLAGGWQEDAEYQMVLMPEAVIDYFAKANDTIRFTLKIAKEEDFGDVHIAIDNRDTTIEYSIHLMKGDAVLLREQVTSSRDELTFSRLLPGNYSLRIIEDVNRNGRWDPGDYLAHKQSERLVKTTLEEVRGSWIIESSLDLQSLFSSNKKSDAPTDQ